MDANEFQRDKAIDPTQLDVECVRQAETFFKWAERSIDARADLDRAKFKLDLVQARLELTCRKKPEDFGLLKPTEAAIKAAVLLTDEHKAAYNAYIDARRESGLLDMATQTMEMRKRQLENLITLHGQKYFAGPSVPRDLMGAYMKHQEETGTSLNRAQRERTRRRGER